MPSYLEIEVTLLEIEPRIWRRFLLRSTSSFRDLHEAIQVAGPWGGHHLWQFCEFGRRRRMLCSDPRFDLEQPTRDGRKMKLGDYFGHVGDRCLYRYDFGDDWEHEVEYVRPHELQESFRRRLLDGERAFPPDDCGGTDGYYECLAALGQHRFRKGEHRPDAEELAERREWLGKWTPELDLEAAKRAFNR